MSMTLSRKQRLRKLENEIRTGMEEFYYTGMKLKEIRDDELYKEDGFEAWTEYVRKRWEWSPDYALKVITSSEYREKLPTNTSGSGQWSERSVRELTRIPDKKQAARVAAKIVKEVERSEKEAAKNPDVKPLKLSASTVQRFVDEDLGIDRHKKAAETRRERDESLPRLEDYLKSQTECIRVIIKHLSDVPGEAWELLEESQPRLAERLATACDDLAELLRS